MDIGRRALIVLHLILEHNRQQHEKAARVAKELQASVMVNPTIGVLINSKDNGLWNDYMNKYPGLDSKIGEPIQIRREVNKLENAGLLEKSSGLITSSRVLTPTQAAVDLMNAVYTRYSKTTPYNWPEKIQIDRGKPNWNRVIDTIPMG